MNYYHISISYFAIRTFVINRGECPIKNRGESAIGRVHMRGDMRDRGEYSRYHTATICHHSIHWWDWPCFHDQSCRITWRITGKITNIETDIFLSPGPLGSMIQKLHSSMISMMRPKTALNLNLTKSHPSYDMCKLSSHLVLFKIQYSMADIELHNWCLVLTFKKYCKDLNSTNKLQCAAIITRSIFHRILTKYAV